jgi:DNA polymerase
MSLDLDKRQRAMLREMGVRIWQPLTPPAPAAPEAVVVEPEIAIDFVAARAHTEPATGDFAENKPLVAPAPAQPASVRPLHAAPATPTPQPEARAGSGAASWRLGEAQALYAEAAHAEGARWLVLAETPAAALQAEPFHPFEGDAGKLLGNMLRAARLNQAGSVLLAPLARLTASGPAAAGLSAALSALVASAQPDVVLVMGRLAAQALLQSSEPLGKLRGQVHSLHGAKTIVTYDANYLLRNPADKARAWDDLCLAMSLVASAVPRVA